jgi:glycosyltransferase involved in cell wall biosynthesis
MSNKTSLALIITELEVGGAERCLVNLATGLDRDRFAPVVYSLAPPPAGSASALVDQLRRAEIPLQFVGVRSTWQFGTAVGRLRRLVARQHPQIVQTFLFHANIVGTLACRFRPRPALVHGMRVADPARWRLLAERRLNGFAERVTCVSRSVADFYVQRAGIPESKIVVIPNGIDVAAYTTAPPLDRAELGVAPGRRLMTFVGRLHAQKGLDWLLELLPGVLSQVPDVDVVLVGRGPERQRLQTAVGSLGLADRVHFAGWRADVPGLLRASCLLVLPSRWEGMPNAVLEAMAAGLPVVSTRVQGVAELLGEAAEPQTAACGDHQEFAAKLVQVLGDRALADQLGRQNRQRAAERFSLAAMCAAYAQLYESLTT